MHKRSHHWIVLFVLPLLIAGCGSAGGAGGVSIEEEWQAGQQLAAQVEQQVRLVRDPAALSYLRNISERLHQQTPMANLPFNYYIVDDNSINAFAIPGGHIYVNRGLIAQADHENMLVGVLAHEMIHVVNRHAVKQMNQANTINTIGSILLGNQGQLAQIAGSIVAGGAMARFSRADEKEADDRGLELMVAAGYNPQGMLDMFQKLLAMDQGPGGRVAQFFANHPGTQDRINDITSRIKGRNSGTVDTKAYHSNLKDRM